jgi:hypothetical protein
MTGYSDPGIIPRLTGDLFSRVRAAGGSIKVWVSYLEIYNEKIRDLLRPSEVEDDNLNVFEHQKLGVVVPDATVAPVSTEDDVNRLMEYGLKKRASAATSMNATSSRSHAIYTLHIETRSSISKINLIDLAGSERITKSNATGDTQREASMINQSLTNLGIVIKSLSEKKEFVPFRNSKLTFLLKDSLSGNSRTYMIANVSPSASELEETMSTLRFASNVKKIATNPRINYGTHEDIINSLKSEIAELKAQLLAKASHSAEDGEDVGATMKLKSAVLKMVKASFGRKISEVKAASLADDRSPYLMNISDDPLLAGVLAFHIHAHESCNIGSGTKSDRIAITGDGVVPDMAVITNTNPKISLKANADGVAVNGRRLAIGETIDVVAGNVLTFGENSMFRLVYPDGPSSPKSPKMKRNASPSVELDHLEYLIKSNWMRPDVDDTIVQAREVSQRINEMKSTSAIRFRLRVMTPSGEIEEERLAVEAVRPDGLREMWSVHKYRMYSGEESTDANQVPLKLLESIGNRIEQIQQKTRRLARLSNNSHAIFERIQGSN